MMIGWAYLMAAIMTVDSLLLGLLLFNMKWPKSWRRTADAPHHGHSGIHSAVTVFQQP